MKKLLAMILCLMLVLGMGVCAANAEGVAKGEPMHIIFFVGGDAGDSFASIVYKGAMAAAELLEPCNVTVDYVFSGWQTEKMVSQLREAIAMAPDAICMMGHAGDDALMGLAEEAKDAGILMMYQNVDVPAVRGEYGGGFVGLLSLEAQGIELANRCLTDFDLKEGDRALVLGAWGQPGRYYREEGFAATLEGAGIICDRIVAPPEAATDPQVLLPTISAELETYPDLKLIQFTGSQTLDATSMYMEACGKKPGEVICVGYDTTETILKGFEDGWIQLTADQQPFLQGFMPVMSAYLTFNYQLSACTWDTGAGIVDTQNYQNVADLVTEGYR
ncbi:MAG: substrate-binding domain-containing protein [Aristaeellaceae bacterium]